MFDAALFVGLGTCGDGVAVATDADVCAVVAALAGCLTLEHLAVLRDAVAITLGNVVLRGDGIALSGCPCEVVTTDLDVVVGKFAQLVVVHAEKLSLFGGTEVETGDLVDNEGDDGADDERVCGAGDDIGELDVQLFPVVVNPAAVGRVHAVETDDVGCGEDAVEEETDHSSDTVLSEHIESIIDLDPELDCIIVRFVKTVIKTWTYS